jgi:hypothetical protein
MAPIKPFDCILSISRSRWDSSCKDSKPLIAWYLYWDITDNGLPDHSYPQLTIHFVCNKSSISSVSIQTLQNCFAQRRGCTLLIGQIKPAHLIIFAISCFCRSSPSFVRFQFDYLPGVKWRNNTSFWEYSIVSAKYFGVWFELSLYSSRQSAGLYQPDSIILDILLFSVMLLLRI